MPVAFQFILSNFAFWIDSMRTLRSIINAEPSAASFIFFSLNKRAKSLIPKWKCYLFIIYLFIFKKEKEEIRE